MKKVLFATAITALACVANAAQNFPDRKAYAINLSPHVEITNFTFANEDRDRGRGLSTETRFMSNYSWKSTSQQPIVALEIVMLKSVGDCNV